MNAHRPEPGAIEVAPRFRFGINPMQYYARPDGTHDWEHGPKRSEVYRWVAGHGFEAVQAGLSSDAEAAELAAAGLHAAPGYLSFDAGGPGRDEDVAAAVDRAAERSAVLGLDVLVIACRLEDDRKATAGRRANLPIDVDAIARVARRSEAAAKAAAPHGVRVAFHPHVGTVIETGAEIDALMAATDPELVGLCPDTGHQAWAGVGDVPAFLERHFERIVAVHVKDVSLAAAAAGRAAGEGYGSVVQRGLWREPGYGDLDLRRALATLAPPLWCVMEVDVPYAPTADESVARCARFVETYR